MRSMWPVPKLLWPLVELAYSSVTVDEKTNVAYRLQVGLNQLSAALRSN